MNGGTAMVKNAPSVTRGQRLSDKREFTAVDFFRIVAAVMVISVHTHPFSVFGIAALDSLDYFFSEVGVTFFFVATGFFVYERLCDNRAALYIKRILKMYIVYTLIYIPVNILDYINSGKSITDCIVSYVRNFLFLGVIPHLWYFVATIVGAVLIFVLKNKLKLSHRAVFVISLVLYLCGGVVNTFRGFFCSLPAVGSLFELYFKVFETARNGLFYGFFFICLGGHLKRNSSKIKKSRIYPVLTTVLLVLFYVETIIHKGATYTPDYVLLLLTAPLAVFLFLTLAFVKGNAEKGETALTFRKMSVVVYGIHPFVIFWFEFLLAATGINFGFVRFAAVTVISFAIAFATVKLSSRAKVLKNLY